MLKQNDTNLPEFSISNADEELKNVAELLTSLVIGDSVKVIGKTLSGSTNTVLHQIGTIGTITDIEIMPDGKMAYAVTNKYGLTFYYLPDALEKVIMALITR